VTRAIRVFAIAGAALGLACEDVPSVTFDAPDGAVDAMAGDGWVPPSDAPSSDAPIDGAADGGCPDQVPSGAAVCCGAVPCNGNCAGMCAACEAACGSATVCCAHANNVVCRAPGAPCN
jgi:hypothetical protein